MKGVQVVGNSQCLVAFRKQYSLQVSLEHGSEVDAVTKSGRLFHTRAAATGKARSPTVDSHDRGMTRACVDAERRRRREPRSATSRRSLARYGGARP